MLLKGTLHHLRLPLSHSVSNTPNPFFPQLKFFRTFYLLFIHEYLLFFVYMCILYIYLYVCYIYLYTYIHVVYIYIATYL